MYEKCKGTRARCFEVNLGNRSSPLKCKPDGKATALVAAVPFDMAHTMQMNARE